MIIPRAGILIKFVAAFLFFIMDDFLTEEDKSLFLDNDDLFPPVTFKVDKSAPANPKYICYGCQNEYDMFCLKIFRDKSVCDTCFENDALLRHLMEIKQTEKVLSQNLTPSEKERILLHLSEICMERIRPGLITIKK